MSSIAELGILYAAALLCCAIGFKSYVYFISVGYGLAILGQGLVLLILHAGGGAPAVIFSLLLMLYGTRLSGFLLIRSHSRSSGYNKAMKGEIKDGKGMKTGAKIGLWVGCGLLYLAMIAPVIFRLRNGGSAFTGWDIAGLIVAVGGIALESASDLSKSALKKKAPNRFCDQGLFRLVRCPNYLGELIMWTGVLIAGLGSMRGAGEWILALLGYIGIVFVMFSGARRLELRQERRYGSDPAYQEYVRTVPILLPFVPLYSVKKYKFLVL